MPYSSELFYRDYLNGNMEKSSCPLILLHGSGGSHMAWPIEIRRMPGQPTIALDLPGHGKSDKLACHNIDSLVNKLQHFMQELGIYHVILAGHSLGAILALKFASRYPKRIKGLMLLSCGSHFAIPDQLFDTLLLPNMKTLFVEQFSQIAFDPHFPQTKRRLFLDPLIHIRTSTLLADLTICSEFTINGELERITCPVSLINGARDSITLPVSARQLTHQLTDATLSLIPNCGHLLLYEKTTLISQMMRDSLNKMTAVK